MKTSRPVLPAIAAPKLHLQTTLAVSFILQVLVTVGLVGYLSFRNGLDVIRDLSKRVQLEVAERANQVLYNYFHTSPQVIETNINALKLNQINLNDKTALEQYFIRQMQVFPSMDGLFVGTPNGTVIYAGKQADGQFFSATTVHGDQRTLYRLDPQGRRLRRVGSDRFDVSAQPWYQLAVTSKQLSWTSIYQSRTVHSLGIAATAPYYDREGRLVAVFGSFISLHQVSTFLQALHVSPNGQVFILDPQGLLMATSTGEKSFRVSPGENELKAIYAVNSQNLLTSRTAQYLHTRFRDLNQINQVYEFSFNLDGNRQNVLIQTYQTRSDQKYLVVVVVPELDFTYAIVENVRTTILLCIVGVVVALLAGVFITRWISSPLLSVARAAEAISQGDIQSNLPSSPLVEIDQLARSFNRMSGQLQASFTVLEDKNEALRLAEENYRSIFENALEGIFQASPTGQFVSVNPAMAQIFGYDSAAEMIQSITCMEKQIHVEPEQWHKFQQSILSQQETRNFECRVYRKDGSIIWVQVDAHVVLDKTGQVLYYEGLLQDITEQKRREETLKRQVEALRIEIDQKKRKQQVQEITESDFFQSLKSRAHEMRQKRQDKVS